MMQKKRIFLFSQEFLKTLSKKVARNLVEARPAGTSFNLQPMDFLVTGNIQEGSKIWTSLFKIEKVEKPLLPHSGIFISVSALNSSFFKR